jgi:hypothetical protein
MSDILCPETYKKALVGKKWEREVRINADEMSIEAAFSFHEAPIMTAIRSYQSMDGHVTSPQVQKSIDEFE